MQIRASLTTLLAYNLLKGGTAAGAGVFMHDIIRDYTIGQLEGEELQAKQAAITQALLDARPESGFPTAEAPSTLEGYVARHLFWHMRGALADGETPPEDWIAHEDGAVLRAVAMAIGYDALMAMAGAEEAAGKHLHAARYAWVAGKLGEQGRLSGEVWSDCLYRAADLLALVPEVQREQDVTVLPFTQLVFSALVCFIILFMNKTLYNLQSFFY